MGVAVGERFAPCAGRCRGRPGHQRCAPRCRGESRCAHEEHRRQRHIAAVVDYARAPCQLGLLARRAEHPENLLATPTTKCGLGMPDLCPDIGRRKPRTRRACALARLEACAQRRRPAPSWDEDAHSSCMRQIAGNMTFPAGGGELDGGWQGPNIFGHNYTTSTWCREDKSTATKLCTHACTRVEGERVLVIGTCGGPHGRMHAQPASTPAARQRACSELPLASSSQQARDDVVVHEELPELRVAHRWV